MTLILYISISINKKLKLSDLDFRQNIDCFLLNFADEYSYDQSHSRTVVCLRATHSGVSLLNESTVLNESSESMIQWPIHKDSHLPRFWMNQPFEWINWMNQ